MWAYIEGDVLRFLDDMSSTPSSSGSFITTSTVISNDLNWITRSLVIRNVQLSDEGDYVCITENGITLQNLTDIILTASAHLDVTLGELVA